MTCKIQPINSAIIIAYNFEEQTSKKRPKKPKEEQLIPSHGILTKECDPLIKKIITLRNVQVISEYILLK